MQFEWDEKKNQTNIRKHKVSFEEAQTVFFDPLTKVAADIKSPISEERFLAVGRSSMNNLLLVVHCFRMRDQTIRIISARKATRMERLQYEEGL